MILLKFKIHSKKNNDEKFELSDSAIKLIII